MKNSPYRIFAALVAAALAAGSVSASSGNTGRVSVRQNTFAVQGDSVYVGMQISLNGVKVAKRSYVTLTPVIEWGEVERELPKVRINSRNQYKVYRRQQVLKRTDPDVRLSINATDRKAPQNYLYRASVPYEPWMDASEFRLREDQCKCNGPLVPISFELLASRLENLNPAAPVVVPEPEQPMVPKPVYMPQLLASYVVPQAEAVKMRSEAGKAYINFEAGKSVILPEYKNNPAELTKIDRLVSTIVENPDCKVTGMSIIGYASPEGTYASNMTLSERRATALKGYIDAKYGFGAGVVRSEGRGENWHDLDTLVARSSMAYKTQILTIIRGTDIFDGREKRLMNLGGGIPYREMLRDMFPQLRRSDYEVFYEVQPFTVEKGKEVFKTRPGDLSLNEMFLVSQTYEPGSSEFAELFETAARVFPASDQANVNAAASALSRADLQSAQRYLDKVAVRDGAYWNNAGVLAYQQKALALAVENFTTAQALGNSEAARNLEEIEKATK